MGKNTLWSCWEGTYYKIQKNSIGKLRHLRFLNLSKNSSIECLPDDLIKLENLQTLDLNWCKKLKELPRDFFKLSNLRHLFIFESGLIELPLRFGELKSLRELDKFIVGKNNGINSLPELNFIGKLYIEFGKRESDIDVEAQRAKLKDYQELTCLKLSFTRDFGETNEMLECLQLPPNLREFDINGYKGIEMPRRWLDGLSKLFFIVIRDCRYCRVLPQSLSQLPHLKYLRLSDLESLEYIEDEDGIRMSGGGEKHRLGWTIPSKDDDGGEQRQLLSFPCLWKLIIEKCPKLMSMPLAPKLVSLQADVINWKLLVSNPTSINYEESSSSASSVSSSTTLFPSLKKLKIVRIDDALSINLEEVFQSIACITTLQTLKINTIMFGKLAMNLKQLPEEMGKLSLLRELQIYNCPKLASLPRSLLGLTSLQTLKIRSCPELKERYAKPYGQDCHLLQHIPYVEFTEWLQFSQRATNKNGSDVGGYLHAP